MEDGSDSPRQEMEEQSMDTPQVEIQQSADPDVINDMEDGEVDIQTFWKLEGDGKPGHV